MDWCSIVDGVLAQLGEHLPYKQRVTGSSPVGPIRADVAQLAEQLICNQQFCLRLTRFTPQSS